MSLDYLCDLTHKFEARTNGFCSPSLFYVTVYEHCIMSPRLVVFTILINYLIIFLSSTLSALSALSTHSSYSA